MKRGTVKVGRAGGWGHVVGAGGIAVVGLEQHRLVDGHLREPVPAVRRIVRDDQPLERPLRPAGLIEHGIGSDEVLR